MNLADEDHSHEMGGHDHGAAADDSDMSEHDHGTKTSSEKSCEVHCAPAHAVPVAGQIRVSSTSVGQGVGLTITYRLNEAADSVGIPYVRPASLAELGAALKTHAKTEVPVIIETGPWMVG